eukprot:TRINITY_DN79_c0_g1_i1.p1 TRINITY_DN79_c0_g1~~TRINITY_DN79_c0_g1_i1.p1  ORF type:complete len:156 (+),score=41.56 TRINITY_DN79_c0_g1_i1:66-533(+)
MTTRLYETATRVAQMFKKEGFINATKRFYMTGEYKSGDLVGTDRYGNKYYEQKDPSEVVVYGRTRWIEFSSNWNPDASDIPPEWHSWLHHTGDRTGTDIRKYEPQRFHLPHHRNTTGTEEAYVPSNFVTRETYNPNVAKRKKTTDIRPPTLEEDL